MPDNKTIKEINERQTNIELLRIIAMILIVACHFGAHGGFEFSKTKITIPYMWCSFIKMGGSFGVNIFVLISGYFLISEKDSPITKKVLKLWGQVIFYSILLFLIAFLIGKGSLNPKVMIKSLFPITCQQWWFASSYFVLFLLHPYLNVFLHNLDKKQFQKLILIEIFIFSIIPTFTQVSYPFDRSTIFIILYTIAGYIKLFGLNKEQTCKYYFCVWTIFPIIIFSFFVFCISLGKSIPFLFNNATDFYNSSSIFSILGSVYFFKAFKTMKIKNNSLINKIAKASFGVYLIHDSNLLRPVIWQEIFKNSDYQNTNLIIPYSIAVIILVYVVCTIIDCIRQIVFEKAYMKMVNRYIGKISNLIEKIFKKITKLVNKIA